MKRIIVWIIAIALVLTGVFFISTYDWKKDADESAYQLNVKDLENGVLTVTYDSTQEECLKGITITKTENGVSTEVQVEPSMVTTHIDTSKVGPQKLQINYSGQTFYIEVVVKHKVEFVVNGSVYRTFYGVNKDAISKALEDELRKSLGIGATDTSFKAPHKLNELLPAPEMSGYNFTGWLENSEIAEVLPAIINRNITFTASYQAIVPELSAIDAVYGDQLADIQLPSTVAGEWRFKNAEGTVGNASEEGTLFDVVFVEFSTGNVIAEDKVTVFVEKKKVTFTDVVETFIYNGQKQLPTFKVDAPALNLDHIMFYENPTLNYTDVGTYEYSFVIVDDNYEGVIEGTYEIKPIKVTVTIKLAKDEIHVGEALPKVEYEVLGLEGLSDEEIAQLISVTDLEKIVTGAGEYTVTATTANTNIDLQVVPATLTILSGELVVEPPTLNATYGDALGNITFPDNPYGWWEWVNADDAVGNVGTNQHLAVFVPREQHKYDKKQYVVNVVVATRELEIKFDEADDTDAVKDDKMITVYYTPGKAWTVAHSYADKASGSPYVDANLKVYYTINGVDYDTISFTNAGTYEVKVTLVNGTNYKAASNSFAFIVKSIDPTVEVNTDITSTWKPGLTLGQIALPTAPNGHFVWGDWTKNEDGSAYKDGSAAAATVQDSSETPYSKVATFIPDDETNYNRICVTFQVKVNKATPTITGAKDVYEFAYNGSIHTITGVSASYEDAPALEYTYLDGTEFTGVANAGTYTVVITLPQSTNYEGAQIEVTVKVNKIDPAKPTQRWDAIYGDLVLDKIDLPEHDQGAWSIKNVDATTQVGDVGQQTFTAIFTPTTGNYNSIEVSITVTVAKKTVNAPEIAQPNKVYTGALINSGLTSAEGYTVIDNGGINVGTYKVQVILDTTSYAWSTLETASTFELEYNIIRAENAWDNEPTIKSEWTYGDTDGLNDDALAEYKGTASALHGTVTVLYAPQGSDNFSATFPTDAGQYIAKFTASDPNYNDLVKTLTFTINKQTVNIPDYTDVYVYTGSDITADIPTSALYSMEGNVAKNAGSHTATLTLKDSANYKWSNGNSNALTLEYVINKAPVALSVTMNGWIYNETTNTPVVTVNKNFSDEVSYTVQYSADGTEWGTAIPTNAGTYTVRVTVEGTANYTGAEATCTLTIAKAGVTINGANDSYTKIFDGEEFTITGVTASNGETVKMAITKNGEAVDAIIGAGEYVITYSVAEVANYLEATKTVTVTVGKADVTISAPVIEGWTYRQAAKAPSASFNELFAQTSNKQITFKYFTDAECENEITEAVNAGTYYVKAVFAGNDDLNAAQSTPTAFAIAKATVEIPSVSDKEYNGTNQTSGLNATDLYTIYEDAGRTEHGECRVILELIDPSNYVWATSSEALVQDEFVTIEYEILTAVNKWTMYPAIDSWTFGDAGNAGTAEALACEQLIIEYKLRGADSTYSTTRPSNAGDYIARFTAKDSNYKDLIAEVPFTIYKQAITAPTEYVKEYTYNGSNITAVIPTSTLYTITNNVAKTVGDYDAILTLTDSANYKWSDTDAATTTVPYSIVKATVTLDLTLADWTYGQAANEPQVTISKDFADNVTASVEYLVNGAWVATAPTAAGTYTVKVEVAGTANYNGAQVTLEFTVEKAGVTISGVNDSYEKDYNGNEFTLTGITASNGATVTKTITKNGESVDKILGVGEYVITYSVAESANYLPATKNVNVTVEKADVTISTPVIDGWTYTEAAKAPSASFNELFAQGSNSEITFKYFTNAECDNEITEAVNAGTYYVKAVFAGNDDLNATESEAASFVIAKKVITTPTVANKVYNGQNQTSGLDSDLYTVTEVGGKDVADYTVTVTLNTPANYAWDDVDNENATVTVTYSITKASVSLKDLAITGWVSGKYDATQNKPTVTVLKDFTGDVTLSFEYYVNGEWGTAIPTLAGSYAVRAVVADTDNYTGATTSGINFQITTAVVTLPANNQLFTYTGTVQKPVIAESVYYTVVGNIENTVAGEYSFTIVPVEAYSFVWAGEEGTAATEKAFSYTIQKASVTLSGLTMNNWTYNETASTPNVTVKKSFSDELTVRYEYYDANGNLLAACPTNAGKDYKVKAIVDGTDNYNGQTIEKEFTISKATATLSTPTFEGAKNGKYYLNQIAYSTTGLSATHAGQTVAGSFSFGSIVFVAGNNKSYIELTFTPNDTANYETVKVPYSLNIVTVAVNESTNTSYGSIEAALAAAVPGGKIRVMPHDADLGPIYIKEDVTIKENVTLLLPYGTTDDRDGRNQWTGDQPFFELHGGSCNTTNYESHNDGDKYRVHTDNEGHYPSEQNANKCIVKVVLAQGLTITITNQGILEIDGELSGGGAHAQYAGFTAGKHATLVLDANAKIISESGSKIYAAGFIRESSTKNGSGVVIQSGATLFQPYTVKDFRDGTYMAAAKGNMKSPYWVSPYNRFLLMNVSPELTIYYGGSMTVWASLFTGSTENNNTTTVTLIGTDKTGAVLALNKSYSYLKAKYDTKTEICELTIYGGAKTQAMNLNIEDVAELSTDQCFFPLTYHYQITLCKSDLKDANGNLLQGEDEIALFEMGQRFKLMPGASLTVAKGARLTASTLVVYENFVDNCAYHNAHYRYPTGKSAAKLIVNGELICDYLGGKVSSNTEGAKVTINSSTSYTMYEIQNVGGKAFFAYVSEWNTFTEEAKLVHADKTAIAPAKGKTWEYVNGVWETSMSIHFDVNGGDEEPSIIISTSDTVYPTLPTPTRTHYIFQGWKDASGNVISAGSALPTTKDVTNGITLTAQWKPQINFVFKYEGWEAGSEPENTLPSSVEFDIETGAITLPTPTGTGTFVGWYKDEACTELIISTSSAELKGNDTIYGLWTSKQFTIKFEGDNYGDHIQYENDTVIYTPTKLLTATLPVIPDSYKTDTEKKEYFDGWYYNGQKVTDFSFIDQSTSGEYTLTAKWVQKFTVIFKHGDTVMGTYYLIKDQTITTPAATGVEGWESGTGGYYMSFNNWSNSTYGNVNAAETYQVPEAATDVSVAIEYTADLTKSAYAYNAVTISVASNTKISVTGGSWKNADGTDCSAPSKKGTYYLLADPSATISVTASSTNTSNYNALLGLNGATETSTVNQTAAADQLSKISTNTEYIGGSSSCITAGTLVTLADGTQKKVEDLTMDDILLVFNHETGEYEAAGIIFIENDGWKEYNVITLTFSDGTTTKLIYEHAYFDLTLNKYVYITEQNYTDFIGHEFAMQSENGFERVTMIDATLAVEYTGCYSLVTVYHLNYFVDGLFSIPGGITGLFNIFEYGDDLVYDEEKMQADIEEYGLFTYEDFEEFLPYEFYVAFPASYLKVSIGKGLMTFDDIFVYIDQFLVKNGLM